MTNTTERQLSDVPKQRREVYERYLRDRKIRGWLMDMVTGEVHTEDKTWPNIMEFAQHHGMDKNTTVRRPTCQKLLKAETLDHLFKTIRSWQKRGWTLAAGTAQELGRPTGIDKLRGYAWMAVINPPGMLDHITLADPEPQPAKPETQNPPEATQTEPPKEKQSYVYLASPYSHDDPLTMEKRFHAACKVAARLMGQGELIFSPVAHTHPIAVAGELPRTWDFWRRYDHVMLAHASKVLVLKLDRWEESLGVSSEIRVAKEFGIPIEYIDEDFTGAGL